MTFEDFVARLDGARRMGDGKVAARCPGHDDRMQSLVVSDGGDRLLVACHAGCSAGDVVRALGLGLRDLFYVQSHEEGGVVNIGRVTPKAVPPAGQGGAAPVLRRPKGGPMMPGEFMVESWMRAVPDDMRRHLFYIRGWSAETLNALNIGWDGLRMMIPVYGPDGLPWSLVRWAIPPNPDRGVERLTPKTLATGPRELWPCPESFPDGCDLWLVEGEPDAISARELGLSAVAVPGVAAWKPGWAERFRGHRVTVAFDCDGPGRGAAVERVRQFGEVGVQAVMVDLWPGRDDGYDLGDLLVGATQQGRRDDCCRHLLGLEGSAWARLAA